MCECLQNGALSGKDKLLLREMAGRERERAPHSILMLSVDQIGCLYFCGCKRTPGMLLSSSQNSAKCPQRIGLLSLCLLILPAPELRPYSPDALSFGGRGGDSAINSIHYGGGINEMGWLLKGFATPLCVFRGQCYVSLPRPNAQ